MDTKYKDRPHLYIIVFSDGTIKRVTGYYKNIVNMFTGIEKIILCRA